MVYDKDSVYSLASLEAKLVSYINDPSASETPIDISAIPKVSREQAAQESARMFGTISGFYLLTYYISRSKFFGHD
jgi:hypothetical protein